MNKQGSARYFAAGQAMDLPRGAVLTAGEVQVQPPSRWVGGQVVVTAPARFVAPAPLPADSESVVMAVDAVTVWVPKARPLPGSDLVRAAWAWMRAMPARRQGVPS